MKIIENNVTVIPYTSDLKEAIKILNYEWLNRYFKIEPKDERVLSDPQGEIIDKGGLIFYAKYNDQVVGTFSLLKIEEGVFELTKMAVTNSVQGLGVGTILLSHLDTVIVSEKIKKLILYSNRKLHPALHLYRKFGFIEVLLEDGVYDRADIKMEKIIF
jgi:ribosomal protein S18 acetylase RimI-like enzyme